MSLSGVTLVYLTLPLILFLLGWLRLALGLPLAMLLIASVYLACRSTAVSEGAPARPVPGWPWALVIALIWVALSGAWPFGVQLSDWEKHNAVLKDLVFKPWPVAYANAPAPPEPGRAVLVYYMGYYLPAASIGKLMGWAPAYAFLFGWTVLGAFLALVWFARLVGHAPLAAMVIFVLASGLDILALLVLGRGWNPAWAGLLYLMDALYPSNVQQLLWTPQHGLGGWLSTALVIEGGRRGTLPPVAGLVVVSALFWSPFAALGLLPFVAYGCARQLGQLLAGWSNWTTCVPIVMVLGAFFASLAVAPPHGFADWPFVTRLWRRYLLFQAVEVWVYGVLCALILRRERTDISLLAVSWLCLVLIPIYHTGIDLNDFVIRVSMPSLFVLWVLVARSLLGASLLRYRALLWLAFLVGAVGPVAGLSHAISHFRVGVPPLASIDEIPIVHKAVNPGIARQYVGDRHSFFFRFLAK